jgi:Flp pilus assembly protein TadG
MKTARNKIRHSRKAQSLIEFALGGILLVMLLAAAVDFGRAFYTYVVVQNMAGEGASYLAQEPDNDITSGTFHGLNSDTFQYRARNVAARVMGSIISPENVHVTNTNATSDVRFDVAQSDRCAGTEFTVSVAYHLNDLFFPAFLGVNNITVGASEQSYFTSNTLHRNPPCPTPTPLP